MTKPVAGAVYLPQELGTAAPADGEAAGDEAGGAGPEGFPPVRYPQTAAATAARATRHSRPARTGPLGRYRRGPASDLKIPGDQLGTGRGPGPGAGLGAGPEAGPGAGPRPGPGPGAVLCAGTGDGTRSP